MLLQLQHLGLICAYAWWPLALWGVDQMIEHERWQALWRTLLASTFTFLAGYPPNWIVFAILTFTYGALRLPFRSRHALNIVITLLLSLVLASVQLLPSSEAASFKELQARYGLGIQDLRFYVASVIPNYFDFSNRAPVDTNYGYEYLYVGAVALFGIYGWLRSIGRVERAEWYPFVALFLMSLTFVVNPFNAVWSIIQRSAFLADLIRGPYFLVGLTLAVAGLTALGFDYSLQQDRRAYKPPIALLFLSASIIWSVSLIWIWLPRNDGVPVGWRSGLLTLGSLALLTLGVFLYQGALPNTASRRYVAASLLLLAGVDYKVFGTSLRMNAASGNVDEFYAKSYYPGMRDEVYVELRKHNNYRVVSDLNNSSVLEIRHFGLSTPQGFDPLVPRDYLLAVKGGTTDPWIDIHPVEQKALLRMLGVGYVMTIESGPRYSQIATDPEFRLVSPDDSFWKIFKFTNSGPPYRWESRQGHENVVALRLEPELREFMVESGSDDRFVLVEQFYPGWEARIDGRPVNIQKWAGTFQAVAVPHGRHHIQFRFRSRTLRIGAMISLIVMLCLVSAAYRDLTARQRKQLVLQK
jgi:hypothetical protein